MIIGMSTVKREQSVEFVCIGLCEDPPTYMVDGHFNAAGKFEPALIDEMGSDIDCPECGERGEPTSPDVIVADL
jgi:hypothetical protein